MSTETKIDKSEWPPGPWMDEPDRIEFEVDGFPALITRTPSMGHLCGYLAVPPGHPWHGTDGGYAEVHGGITYSAACSGHVCHVPKPGEPDNVWWMGFDCAHAGDLQPGLSAMVGRIIRRPKLGPFADVYRTVDYVRGQIAELARQARAAERSE